MKEAPQLYSISQDEFSIPVDEPKIFDGSQKPTRENFASWLNTSFRVSKGLIAAQTFFWGWTYEKFGFDHQASLHNFALTTGPINWENFSSKERQIVVGRFRHVGAHKEIFEDEPYTQLIALGLVWDQVTSYLSDKEDMVSDDFQIAELNLEKMNMQEAEQTCLDLVKEYNRTKEEK